MKPKRNPWVLIGWGAVWAIVFWFGGLFLAGTIAGAMNPGHGAEAGRLAGETWSGPLFLLALVLSPLLTYLGVMPGTRHGSKPSGGAQADLDVFGTRAELDALERLGQLHRNGVLTDDEFTAQKAVVLNRHR